MERDCLDWLYLIARNINICVYVCLYVCVYTFFGQNCITKSVTVASTCTK